LLLVVGAEPELVSLAVTVVPAVAVALMWVA
jgi:hypothetical protein